MKAAAATLRHHNERKRKIVQLQMINLSIEAIPLRTASKPALPR
jgi:hypothetical protein